MRRTTSETHAIPLVLLLGLVGLTCKTVPSPPPASPAGAAGEAAPPVPELAGQVASTLFKISISRHHRVPKSGAVPPEHANQRNEDTWKGDPGKLYDVTFHVRGIVEPRIYEGGRPDPASPFVQVGGTASDRPGEHGRQYAVFKVEVSDPEQVYFLNKDHANLAHHEVYPIDYRLNVKVRGGARVAVALVDQPESGAIANHRDLVLDGIPPGVLAQPFKDQFLYVVADRVAPAAD
jgi:hypothetical protein